MLLTSQRGKLEMTINGLPRDTTVSRLKIHGAEPPRVDNIADETEKLELFSIEMIRLR